jgi:2-oxoglutarate dehydrogenase E2 component (dihydrolipoamide succinyltransferase)
VPRAAELAAAGAGLEEIRRVRSSPVVRRIAREHNIDIAALAGSGVSGRVTKKDILAVLGGGAAAGPAAAAPRPAPGPARPAFAPGERTVVEPMTVMRRKIAEHMVQSKRTSAHVTSVFEVDLHRVQTLRARHQEEFQKRHGVKLTVTPFFVKAAVEALKTFPKLNASIDGDNIVYRKDIHIGVAVALDWGLIVPVIRNAEDRTISGLAKAIADLADRARAKKLAPEDVQGGTFTITNPGPEGALIATPIINQPQMAILGVGSIHKRPVVVDDAIAIRPVVFLSLSWDHRLIDGVDADRFMTHVKRTLEEANFPEIL